MTTFGYARVSTLAQAEKNTIDAQRQEIEAWLRYKGVTIEPGNWYSDDGVSGAKMNRPGITAMMERVGKDDLIVCYSLSRLGRTALGLMNLVADLRAKGAQLQLLRESVNTDTPAGRLFLNNLAGMAEYEREIIGERTSCGIRARIARGQKWGGARVVRNARGCSRLTDEGWLEVGRRFWSKEAKLLDLSRETGMTVASISRKLIKLRKRGH